MKLKTIGLAALLLCSIQVAQAAPFTVSDIRVEGLQRVSAASVFNAFPVSASERVDDRQLADAAKQLFDTGLFEDVSLARDDDVLIIRVEERPSISRVEIDGNSQISDEDLRKGLSDLGLAEGQVLQRASLEEVQRQLEQLYQSQGRYSASIDASVEPVDRNRVQVNINVNEGNVAKIRQINIVGNQAFDDETLRELMQLEDRPGWLFGWFSNDEYSREKLSGDLESLRSYYLDRGYVNFAITSTQVAISPDKSKIFVTVNVDEGKRYRIDEIGFAGDLKIAENTARSLITAETGDIYSRSALTESAEALRQKLGAEGFAFAMVKHGGAHWHYLYSLGGRPFSNGDDDAAWAFGLGIGAHATLTERWFLDVDLLAHYLHDGEGTDELTNEIGHEALSQLRLVAGVEGRRRLLVQHAAERLNIAGRTAH